MNANPTVNGSIAGMFHDYMVANHFENSLTSAYILNWGVDSRVSIFELGLCLKSIQEKDPDIGLGLKISQYFQPIYSGLLGYLILSCKTLNDAVFQFKKYYSLMWDGFLVDISEDNEKLCITWDVPGLALFQNNQDLLNLIRIGYELGISCFIKMLQQLTNEHILINPINIRLPGSKPLNTSIYSSNFKCEVVFCSDDASITFKKESLKLPINLNNQFFIDLIDRKASAYLQSIEIKNKSGNKKFLMDFQKALGRGIEEGNPTFDFVAEAMAISKSTLKTRLIENDLSFQNLLDKIRLELAKMYLEDEYLSLIEIANLLSFSEQSAFNRFFKRVTGITPRQFRKNIQI